MLFWLCVRTSRRRPASTAARFVRAPLLRIACRIKRLSMSLGGHPKAAINGQLKTGHFE
jgi:hypothetical protein